MNHKSHFTFALITLLSHATATGDLAQGGVSHSEGATVITAANTEKQTGARTIDYVNAQPMPLPTIPSPSEAEVQEDLINALTSQPDMGIPGYSAGGNGNGKLTPTFVGRPTAAATSLSDVETQEFGSSNLPFSTSRIQNLINNTFPSQASGKLFFTIDGTTYVCSASLIKRGLVVTAAHCVAQFRGNRYYTNFRFIPAYRNGVAPYGVWTGTPSVLASYLNGTDPCLSSAPGVVCQNDVAVLRVTPQNGSYPGTATGWYGYRWNGFGFTNSGLTHITQIGYPVCLDNGQIMLRNDSQGYRSAAHINNTIIGSLMCGGSSGGPWLVNFGVRPVLTGTTAGAFPDSNVVMGVTSWGSLPLTIKRLGASPFLSTNIVPLVNAACTAVPSACT